MGPDRVSVRLELSSFYQRRSGDPGFDAVMTFASPVDDDQLADLIEADGRLRIGLGRPVALARYLDAVPDLRQRPDLLDAAIDMTLRTRAKEGPADDAVVQTLVREHPDLEREIREAATLSNAMGSTSHLRASLEAPVVRPLPCPFGPPMEDGRPRYELREMLGAGAFGRVYAAIDRKLSEEGHVAVVSIKVLPADGQSAWDRREITEEASKARRIDHPNVVRVLDRGVTDQNEDFIVYEFVDGGDLLRRIRRHPGAQPIARVVAWAAGIARGVHAAHMAGLVHCDLKPANVVLTAAGEPKVADFGIAIRRDERTEDAEESSEPLGTLPFMSPEQYRMEPGSLTIPTDVYAIGAMLYWMLTDELPNGSTPEQIRRTHDRSDERGTPPIADRRPDVDRDLAAIVMRALAPAPAQRHASAAALAADLESWLRREPIPWTRPSVARRLTLWTRRRPSLAVATIVIAIIVIAAGITVERLANLAGRRRAEAVAAQAREQAQEEGLQRARQILNEILLYLDAGIERDLPSEMLPQVWILEWLYGPALLHDDPRRDEVWNIRVEVLRRAVDASAASGGGDDVQSLLWRSVLGFWLVRDGAFAEAEERLADTLAGWRRLAGPDDPWVRDVEAMRACATVGRIGAGAIGREARGRPDHPAELEAAAATLERCEIDLMARAPDSPMHRLVLQSLLRAAAPDLLDRPAGIDAVLARRIELERRDEEAERAKQADIAARLGAGTAPPADAP